MPTDKFGFWCAIILAALIASTLAAGSTRPAQSVLTGVDLSIAGLRTIKDAAINGTAPQEPQVQGKTEPSGFMDRWQQAQDGTVDASFWKPLQGKFEPKAAGCVQFVQVDERGARQTWACPPFKEER